MDTLFPPGYHQSIKYHAARERGVDPSRIILNQSVRRRVESLPAPLAERLYQVETAHDKAREAYNLKVYPGKIIYFWADGVEGDTGDARVGWKHAARELEIHHVPGDHTSMFQEPNVRILAEKLKDCLEKG